MRHWFKDQHFRSLLKNSSYLAASRIVAAFASLATVSFAAHALGVLLFGALILITSYARAVSGIAKFQSWQLIVRYGGRVLQDEHEDFKTSTGFAFALDAVSGVGGMLAAVAILPFIATWVGIPSDQLWLAMLYCTLLPTMGAATPTGVLRALDRFDLISWQSTAAPIARVVLVTIAYFANALSRLTWQSGTSPTSAAISTAGSSAGESSSAGDSSKAFVRRSGRKACRARGGLQST